MSRRKKHGTAYTCMSIVCFCQVQWDDICVNWIRLVLTPRSHMTCNRNPGFLTLYPAILQRGAFSRIEDITIWLCLCTYCVVCVLARRKFRAKNLNWLQERSAVSLWHELHRLTGERPYSRCPACPVLSVTMRRLYWGMHFARKTEVQRITKAAELVWRSAARMPAFRRAINDHFLGNPSGRAPFSR